MSAKMLRTGWQGVNIHRREMCIHLFYADYKVGESLLSMLSASMLTNLCKKNAVEQVKEKKLLLVKIPQSEIHTILVSHLNCVFSPFQLL